MRRPVLYILIPFCLAIAITNAIFHFNSESLPAGHIARFIPQDEHNDTFVRGTIVDDPLMTRTIYKTLKTSFTLKTEAIRRGGLNLPYERHGSSWQKANGLIKVSAYSNKALPVSFGNEVILEGAIYKPHALNNPGLFNYAEYLELKNIYCCLSVKDENAVKIVRGIDSKAGFPAIGQNIQAGSRPRGFRGRGNLPYYALESVKSAAYKIRRRMRTLMDEYLPTPYNGFLKAVLIGDRSGLTEGLKDDFVKTGTVHILAISGLHVGLIAAVFMAIFAFFGMPKKANFALTAAFLVFYSFVAGSNPPILRAVIMFAIYSIGYLIDRETDLLNSLSTAALLILIWNPKELYDPGFQLSFVSVAGIIIFTPKIAALLLSGIPEDKSRTGWGRACRYVADGVSVSIAAWLGSFPIIAAYFNIVSPVSILANLIVIPMLFFIIAASFLFFSFAITLPLAASLVAQVLQFIIHALFAVNALLAKIPLAFLRIGRPSPEFILLCYAFILLLIMPPSINFRRVRFSKARALIILLVLSNIIVWPSALLGAEVGMKMTFLDVGQGDSVFIEFPDGNMLIDGGPGGGEENADMGRSVVAPFLWNHGVRKIDIVLATHFHEDHLGGILYVLKNFKVGCVIDSGAAGEESGKIYEEYLRIIREKNIRKISVREGDCIKAFSGAEIFVLNPEKDKILQDSNDNSIVLKLVYKKNIFLFCADIKDRAMSRLIAYENFLKSDVVKVPHHGGGLGNKEVVTRFFDAVEPAIFVISVGVMNKYDAPSRKTMNIINTYSSKTYMTKYDGAIAIQPVSQGGALGVIKTNKN